MVVGCDEVYFGFFDVLVYVGGVSLDFEWLFGGEFVVKIVLGFGVDIGY